MVAADIVTSQSKSSIVEVNEILDILAKINCTADEFWTVKLLERMRATYMEWETQITDKYHKPKKTHSQLCEEMFQLK